MLQNRDKLYKKAEKIDDETLNDKIETNYKIENEKNYDFILVKDVKDWIKTLKKDLNSDNLTIAEINAIIDRRLGDKLI